jgi:hypothetical protein
VAKTGAIYFYSRKEELGRWGDSSSLFNVVLSEGGKG